MDSKDIFNRIKNHTPKILGEENFKKFAILLPLVEVENEVHVLFEVRSKKMRRQPGEVCFPGGKMDPQDKSEKDAAIRETVEELGVLEKEISNIYPLDYLVNPFGMIIYPFVGFIRASEKIEPNPMEVEETFSVPLNFFMETEPQIHHVNLEVKPEENFPFDLIIGGENYNWRTRKLEEHFYIYDEKVIWGLTAKILFHFVKQLR